MPSKVGKKKTSIPIASHTDTLSSFLGGPRKGKPLSSRSPTARGYIHSEPKVRKAMKEGASNKEILKAKGALSGWNQKKLHTIRKDVNESLRKRANWAATK